MGHRCLIFLFLLLFASAPAHAAEPSEQDREAAKGLFTEARAMLAQGRLEEACTRLEAAKQLVAGVGIMFNLAECYEKQGRTASAWREYLHVISLTVAKGDGARAEAARARAAKLESKLSRLRVVVAEAAPGMTIERNGSLLPQEQWGTPVPVDPGSVEVVAKADGYANQKHTLTIASNPGEMRIEIAPLTKLASAEPAPGPDKKDEPGPDFWASDFAVPGLITTGVGVVAVVTAAILLGVGSGKESDARAICPSAPCSDEVAQLGNDGIALQDAGLGVLIPGLIITAGGGTLLAFAYFGLFGDEEQSSGSVRPTFVASPSGVYGGISVDF
jgi:hypothetical protein